MTSAHYKPPAKKATKMPENYGKRILHAKNRQFSTAQWFAKPEYIRNAYQRLMGQGFIFFVITP